MLRESVPYALLLLQLLMALVTRSLVNNSASSRDFRFTSSDTWQVLLDEECLPSYEVVNWRLKLLAISLGEVWGVLREGDALILYRLLGFAVNSFDRPPQVVCGRACGICSQQIFFTVYFCDPMSLWWSHYSLLTAGAGRDPDCVGVVVVYPLPWPLLVGGVWCSRLWSTSQILRPSGQQCNHYGGVCPQIQGWQCGAYVGAVEEMMCVVCVDVTEGA